MDEEALSQQLLLEDSEAPAASWKHILAVTVFFSLVLLGFAIHDGGLDFRSVILTLGWSLWDNLPPILIGLAIGGFFRMRALHIQFLKERMQEDMDRDNLEDGPWEATDAYGTRFSMLRTPLRMEAPAMMQQPSPLWKQEHPDVVAWLKDAENSRLLESATEYEKDALAWCAQEGTPAGIAGTSSSPGDGGHGETSLFSHVAQVWKQNAASFGVGSDPALLSVSHDLGKVLAYRKTGETWTRRTNRHERLSIMVAMHLEGFLKLPEEGRHRLMEQLIRYSQRKRSVAPAAARKAIQETVRADSATTRAEKSGQVLSLPVAEREEDEAAMENRSAHTESACIIPLRSSPGTMEGLEGPEAMVDEDEENLEEIRINDREICENIPSALAAMNVNAKKRASQQAQGIYCAENGFFVRIFDLVDQMQKMGVAVAVGHGERTKSPWEVPGSRAVLMAMSRGGWIITSPGRFTSDQGNDGVFDLRSGSKRYPGMVSINPELLGAEYLESIGEWCFDVDPV
ncbi:hypothetical protein JKG47_12945 [Acidithiobacillus sp. MC6.1]|nr:hypothetical protein [Acidithiobacillus sp. MC6.1]